jgi:phenylalanyl-tRNA synthetase beta chain
VKNVEVFDIYQGEHVQAGMKSIALSVFYGDDKRTLTDGDVRVIEDEIKSALFHQFKAELRG